MNKGNDLKKTKRWIIQVGQATYVLKSGEAYLKVPFKGSSSIFTTNNILDCLHFQTPDHAAGFLTSIVTLPDTVKIDSNVNFCNVSVVKAILSITEEPVLSD